MINTDLSDKEKYWDGNWNRIFRHWFYIRTGAGILNELRNPFIIGIGISIALKITNPISVAGIILIFFPIMQFMGWAQVHHIGKVLEWLTVKYSTKYQAEFYALQKEQNELLKTILEEFKKQNIEEIRDGVTKKPS